MHAGLEPVVTWTASYLHAMWRRFKQVNKDQQRVQGSKHMTHYMPNQNVLANAETQTGTLLTCQQGVQNLAGLCP